jgi:hypothetical protein
MSPLVVFALASFMLVHVQPLSSQQPASSAEAVVDALYDHVTFDAGTTPDWDAVKKLFIDEAVVVLRTSPDASTVFSLNGFVEDFVRFIERDNVERTGFVESIIRKKTLVFGDIAHILVLYEASIPGWDRPPQQGVDSFQLIRKDDRWKIVSIINEIPTPDRPVPEILKESSVIGLQQSSVSGYESSGAHGEAALLFRGEDCGLRRVR